MTHPRKELSLCLIGTVGLCHRHSELLVFLFQLVVISASQKFKCNHPCDNLQQKDADHGYRITELVHHIGECRLIGGCQRVIHLKLGNLFF